VDEEEDTRWLEILDSELWPERHRPDFYGLDNVVRELTQDEWDRVARIIEGHKLVTEMFCSNHFGGYGMNVYANPVAPGVPLCRALRLLDNHIPGASQMEKPGGQGLDEAWELFSRYTHTEQNKKWIERFGLRRSETQVHYDY